MDDESRLQAADELREQTAWGRNLPAPLRRFLRTEVSGALVLVAAGAAALAWVNSPWSAGYDALWSTELSVEIGEWTVGHDLRGWVNDGLMAFFFFVIGLEVRREFDMGELGDRRRVAVPALAAVGGMLLPVAIYLAFTRGTEASSAWGIVMPTDTALALGVLALVGRRAPARLRAFILTVVIADDVGVLVVIAFVYTGELSYGALAVAAVLYGVVLVLLRLNVLSRPPLILLAIATWVATAESGVHPTIAGVLLGLAVSGVPPERQDLDAGAFAASTVRGSAAREPAASLAARSSLAPHAVTTRGLM